MIYFTADLHLGHKNLLKISNRSFPTVEEMDARLVENWNRKVKGNDTIYIAGDLCHKADDPEKYLAQLKGKKVLIRGNHDGWVEKIDKEKYFITVTPFLEQSLFGRTITFCHYPMLEWKGSRKGLDCARLGYHIHGHIHDRKDELYRSLFSSPNALNAGVDINNFEPVTFEELCENNRIFKEKALVEILKE